MQSFFFIRQDGRNVKVDHHNILYIEARKNYTRLVMVDRTAMVLITLKQWEKILPSELFCRVHRGYIVSVGRMLSPLTTRFVYLQGMNIPVGEQYIERSPGNGDDRGARGVECETDPVGSESMLKVVEIRR